MSGNIEPCHYNDSDVTWASLSQIVNNLTVKQLVQTNSKEKYQSSALLGLYGGNSVYVGCIPVGDHLIMAIYVQGD